MSRVLAAISQHAQLQPDALALSGGARRFSYAALKEEVERAAHTLAEATVEDAGCVGVALGNGIAWVITDLAFVRMRRPTLPLPTFFTEAQASAALKDAGAGWVLSDVGGDTPIEVAGETLWLTRLSGDAARLHPQTAKVTYTSGSTGAPKGVCLSQAQMEQVAQSIVNRFGAQFAGVHAPILPLGVLLENVAGLYSVLIAGGG